MSSVTAASDKLEKTTTIVSLVSVDRVSRALLYGKLRELLNDPPADLLSEVNTLGEAYEWCCVRRPELSAHSVATDRTRASRLERALKLMEARSTRLVPVKESDIEAFYLSAIDPRWSYRWRFRGTTPSPQEFAAAFWSGTMAQFAVRRKGEAGPVGLLSCYGVRHDAGTAHFAFTRCGPPVAGSVDMIEGLFLFISFLFRNWQFRKLYADIPGFNWPLFASSTSVAFEVEGVFRDHDYYANQYWDSRTIAIYRDEWSRVCDELLIDVFL